MKPIHITPRPETHSRAERLSLAKRLAVLAAAIAFPAMAAPDTLGALSNRAAGMAATDGTTGQPKAMPFERPGMSFPGSAFYYLEDPPGGLIALPDTDPFAGRDEANGAYLGSVIDSGPAARSFALRGGAVDRARALECLAQAIWYEAASESEAGQRAVAQVVLNRVAHPAWPSSVCGVVYQGSQRSTGCQFTFTCDGSLRRTAGGASWQKARVIASRALHGAVYAPVGHATHYHTLWVAPNWAASLDTVGTIGAHRFYSLRGKAGAVTAFNGRHSGVEMFIPDLFVPIARTSALPSPSSAPVPATTLEPSHERKSSGAGASQAPSLVPTSEPAARSAIGQVRSEYSRAGQWKDSASSPRPRDAGKTAPSGSDTGS